MASRNKKKRRSSARAEGELSWWVPAPRTGLWRAQHAAQIGLYVIAGVSILATFGMTLLGDPRALATCWTGADRQPWLDWVGQSWSWLRLLPLGVAAGILLALHRPRQALLRLEGTQLTWIVGRRIETIDCAGARVTWERWPGYPEDASRSILRLEGRRNSLRFGLPDQRADAWWPEAPARHAAPDLILRCDILDALQGALARRGVKLAPPSPVPASASDTEQRPAAGVQLSRPSFRSLAALWQRMPLPMRQLLLVVGLAVVLGIPLLAAVGAGVLPEKALAVFSLMLLVLWAVLAFRGPPRAR